MARCTRRVTRTALSLQRRPRQPFPHAHQSGTIKRTRSTHWSRFIRPLSLFGRADYDVTDGVDVHQGNFTKTHTETVLQFSPAVASWAAMVPRNDALYPLRRNSRRFSTAATMAGVGSGANDPWH
jgi:hypothetical protein